MKKITLIIIVFLISILGNTQLKIDGYNTKVIEINTQEKKKSVFGIWRGTLIEVFNIKEYFYTINYTNSRFRSEIQIKKFDSKFNLIKTKKILFPKKGTLYEIFQIGEKIVLVVIEKESKTEYSLNMMPINMKSISLGRKKIKVGELTSKEINFLGKNSSNCKFPLLREMKFHFTTSANNKYLSVIEERGLTRSKRKDFQSKIFDKNLVEISNKRKQDFKTNEKNRLSVYDIIVENSGVTHFVLKSFYSKMESSRFYTQQKDKLIYCNSTDWHLSPENWRHKIYPDGLNWASQVGNIVIQNDKLYVYRLVIESKKPYLVIDKISSNYLKTNKIAKINLSEVEKDFGFNSPLFSLKDLKRGNVIINQFVFDKEEDLILNIERRGLKDEAGSIKWISDEMVMLKINKEGKVLNCKKIDKRQKSFLYEAMSYAFFIDGDNSLNYIFYSHRKNEKNLANVKRLTDGTIFQTKISSAGVTSKIIKKREKAKGLLLDRGYISYISDALYFEDRIIIKSVYGMTVLTKKQGY